MTEMEHITTLCRTLADARDALESVADEIRDERRKVVRPKLRRLKNCVANVRVAEDQLRQAIEDAPHLFASPRTRAIEGIKVGFRKPPGRIEGGGDAASLDRVMARIEKHAPDQLNSLINTKYSINKAALKNVDPRLLAKIGITIVDVDDQVVIAAAAGEIDRLVDALMVDDEDAS